MGRMQGCYLQHTLSLGISPKEDASETTLTSVRYDDAKQHDRVSSPALSSRVNRDSNRGCDQVHHDHRHEDGHKFVLELGSGVRISIEHDNEMTLTLWVCYPSRRGSTPRLMKQTNTTRLVRNRLSQQEQDYLDNRVDILYSIQIENRVLEGRCQNNLVGAQGRQVTRLEFIQKRGKSSPVDSAQSIKPRTNAEPTIANHEKMMLMILYTVSIISMILRAKL